MINTDPFYYDIYENYNFAAAAPTGSIFKKSINDYITEVERMVQQPAAEEAHDSNANNNRRSRRSSDSIYVERILTPNLYNGLLAVNTGISLANLFQGPRVVHHYHHTASARQHGQQRNRIIDFAIGVFATTIGAVALYFVGKHWDMSRQMGEWCKKTAIFQKKFQALLDVNPQHEHLKNLSEITTLSNEIFRAKRRNARTNLVVAIGVATGAVLALIGAAAASTPVILAGTAVGLIALGIFVVKWGANSNGNAQQATQVRRLRTLCNNILQAQQPIFYHIPLPQPAAAPPPLNPHYRPDNDQNVEGYQNQDAFNPDNDNMYQSSVPPVESEPHLYTAQRLYPILYDEFGRAVN